MQIKTLAGRPAAIPRRRYYVYLLLFVMTMINYTDRVNLSVAAHAIAQRFHLSPAALGWLLSAHIWPYIICLAPAGLLIDRFGYRRGGAVSVGFWSFCTLATAIVTTPLALYVARVGLGAGEAANFPIGTRAIRAWAPRREYGFAISTLSLGQWFGTAFGAMTVGAVVQHFGWRGAFVFTGMLGLVWLVVWLLFIRDPQETRWLESEECAQILAEREVGSHASGDILQLLRSQSLWALGLAQGAFVYEAYMLLSWLPNFLQTQRGIAIFRSGLYTAIIYGTAVVVSILLARLSDRWLGQDALRHGARKWVVAASFLPAMLVAMIPAIGATWILVAALTVSVSFLANGIALNTALCNDLIRRPQDAGTAVALFTLISNLVGVTAPIVTGYVVGATGRFNGAFWLTGMILFAGVIVLLALVGGPIGAAERMERLA